MAQMQSRLISCLTWFAAFALPLSALCQSPAPPPTAAEMVERLRPPSGGLTRSSRNLIVEAAAETSAASTVLAKPSLSLSIQFEFNSDRVGSDSRKVLSDLATALQSASLLASKFAVVGHTDAVGSSGHNQRLSESRALAVRSYLVGRGVSADRLSTLGKGASELAIPSDPTASENRRVVIVNLD